MTGMSRWSVVESNVVGLLIVRYECLRNMMKFYTFFDQFCHVTLN